VHVSFLFCAVFLLLANPVADSDIGKLSRWDVHLPDLRALVRFMQHHKDGPDTVASKSLILARTYARLSTHGTKDRNIQ